jgi:hypothetical protein
MRLRRFASWALTGALMTVPALARAEEAVKPYPTCSRTPTDAEVSAAQGAFQAGNASFNEADYDRAITYWEDAYRRDCTAHRLLLNLARAYESNGMKSHAVNALQTYLARSPGTPDEEQIRRRIDKLDEQIKAETPAPLPPGAATGPAPTNQPQPAPTSTLPPQADTEPASSGGKRPLIPLVVAGAGGAIFVVSGIVYLSAQSKISDAEKACPNRKNCDPNVASEGNSARTRAQVSGAFAIGGIAVLGGGLAWYFLSKPEQKTASTTPKGFHASVTPAIGYGYSGLEVAGQF